MRKDEPIPAVSNYAQPDIFIPYGWLDFNQAGLRSRIEEGVVWENWSPLELSLFWECLHVWCKSFLCFQMPCEAGHPANLGSKGAQFCLWQITQFILAFPRSILYMCTLTLPKYGSSDYLEHSTGSLYGGAVTIKVNWMKTWEWQ